MMLVYVTLVEISFNDSSYGNEELPRVCVDEVNTFKAKPR